MTRFRGCIDIHCGKVKQIVGSTLLENHEPTTNHVSEHPALHFASLYKTHNVVGSHVIKLGNDNPTLLAAQEAVANWEGGLQVKF